MNKYTHITDGERRKIEYTNTQGSSIREIATKLRRSPNSISLELKRNSVNEEYSRNKEHSNSL